MRFILIVFVLLGVCNMSVSQTTDAEKILKDLYGKKDKKEEKEENDEETKPDETPKLEEAVDVYKEWLLAGSKWNTQYPRFIFISTAE